ncbi:MAG: FAD binding domain-containing protein [bacterium]|nr:FAD binding domain-containing protein [bacterium]
MEFLRARTIEEALSAAAAPEAGFVSGGTNIVPDLLFGRKRLERVVDISGIRELRFIEEKGGAIRIGALATVTDLLNSDVIKSAAAPLYLCARDFAGPLIRNRATVAGNLMDASPAADLAPPLMAQDGELDLISAAGERTLPLSEFFLDYRKTAVRPGELIRAVSIRPLEAADRSAYYKLQLRRAMAISVVSVALALRMEGETCAEARIGMGAVAAVPYRAVAAERLLQGKRPGDADIEAAAATARESANPIDDIRASAAYRSQMCEVLVRRLLREALGMPKGETVSA